MELKGRSLGLEEYSDLIYELAKLTTLVNFCSATADQVSPQQFSELLRRISGDLSTIAALARVEPKEWKMALDAALREINADPEI